MLADIKEDLTLHPLKLPREAVLHWENAQEKASPQLPGRASAPPASYASTTPR